MNDPVILSQRDQIAIVTIDHPPVNALGTGVLELLAKTVRTASDNPLIDAIVIIGAGSTFSSGADIREFRKIVVGEAPPLRFLPLLQSVEDSSKPVIVAIHGTAFGAGLELAMAGHYRLGTLNAQLGQPEVKLGLIPGAAGTQRLPRLIHPLKAAEMCAWGESVKASEALELGIIDRIIERDLLEGALAFAATVLDLPIPRTRDRPVPVVSKDSFQSLRKKVQSAKRGHQAPLIAIEAVEGATQLSFDAGCQREAELFYQCLHATESKALIHVFFGERAVSKIPGLSQSIRPLEVRHAAVIGAGTMGIGIAMNFSNAGIPVRLKESSSEALQNGITRVRENYQRAVEKGRLTQTAMEERVSRIIPQLDYTGFADLDVVVEAVFEDVSVKKEIFTQLDQATNPSCLLFSNTSSLDVDEIASATQRPQQVAGMHFFSPANVMRLLEVVHGQATSEETVVTAMHLGKRMSKVTVLSRNRPGFIGNRIFRPYLREARFLVEEGASVEAVNEALYSFGMAMGPLAVDDLTGIDILWQMEQEFERHKILNARPPLLLQTLYEMRRYGQKTGAGWSRYDEQRRPSPDPEVATLVAKVARQASISQRAVSSNEIIERCLYALINEAAWVLAEGTALRAVDIDVVFLNGYGFPAWRGGPLFYADTIGLQVVLTRIQEFSQQFGPALWQPAPLLQELALSQKTFSGLDQSRGV